MKKILIGIIVLLAILYAVHYVDTHTQLFHTTGPMIYTLPLQHQITSDKEEYEYGEEIEIEILFKEDKRDIYDTDGHTYCVMIAESPYYEIIGDNIAYATNCDEVIYGEGNSYYWYRVVFKIKVTQEMEERQYPCIYIKCVDDDWLDNTVPIGNDTMYQSDNPEYSFRIELFNFKTDSDGVKFKGIDRFVVR